MPPSTSAMQWAKCAKAYRRLRNWMKRRLQCVQYGVRYSSVWCIWDEQCRTVQPPVFNRPPPVNVLLLHFTTFVTYPSHWEVWITVMSALILPLHLSGSMRMVGLNVQPKLYYPRWRAMNTATAAMTKLSNVTTMPKTSILLCIFVSAPETFPDSSLARRSKTSILSVVIL